MEINELATFKKIKMPDEMKERIIKRCEEKTIREEKNMKKKIKKPLTLGIAIAICLSMSVAVVASVADGGFFKDKTNAFGAVTGSEYLNATEEIEVSVTENKIEVTFLKPDTAPYKYSEFLSVGEYAITNESGEEISAEFVSEKVINGKVSFNTNLPEGKYTLIIKTFISEKKADQPLEINGLWECEFEVK